MHLPIRPYFYRRDGTPYEGGFEEWAKERPRVDRVVAKTDLPNGLHVSTVWLGIDHNFDPDGPPLIFETMVFPTDVTDEYQERYSTEAEALAGHKRAIEKFLSWPSIT